MTEKILIIGPAWVGDMVMADTLFRLLKDSRDVTIDVLAPAWTAGLLSRLPEVDGILSEPFGHGDLKLFKRWQFSQTLRQKAYDEVIVLKNSFKSALIPFFAGITKRTGFRGEMRYGLLNDLRQIDKQKLPLMIQHFAQLGLPKDATMPERLPRPHLSVDIAHAAELAEQWQIDPSRPLLALCPGAEYGPSKRWPETSFAAVANHFLAKDWQIGLFGSGKDRAIADAILQAISPSDAAACFNFTGATSLPDAIDLLSLSAVVLTNDSGLMHIAAAISKPLVVLYGGSSPKFTPP